MLHGNRTYLLQTDDGQILEGHSISAGLDYPGVGPEHSWLNDVGRVTYLAATDKEALDAFQLCSKLEGIIPALEPAHALAKIIELAPKRPKDHLMVLNLSGRGDKDIYSVAEHLGGCKRIYCGAGTSPWRSVMPSSSRIRRAPATSAAISRK